MVGVARRMNQLNALLGVRHGPGAAVLPPDITRIHMEFAVKGNDGHYGPRKFWRSCLPRLKFWNPAIPMVIHRSTNQAGPAAMTIYFRQASLPMGLDKPFGEAPPDVSGQTKAAAAGIDERAVVIDMKNQHSDTILAEFLDKTGAVSIVPTPQEELEIREVQERAQKAVVDREIMRRYREAESKEAALLSQARREAEEMRESV